MKIADVMTAPVITVHPELPLKEVSRLLTTQAVSGVPVVDDDRVLLGMVTEADVISHEAYAGSRRGMAMIRHYLRGHDPRWLRKSEGRTARDIMTRPVMSATGRMDVRHAARLMLEHGVNRLPIVDDAGRVVGIVARHDLLRFFWPGDQQVEAEVHEMLDDPWNDPGRYDITFTVQDGVVTLAGEVQFESDVKVVRSTVAHLPGVVAVDGDLRFRERDPRVKVPFVS